MGAIDFEAITVAGIHLDAAAIAALEGGVVIVAVVGIQPAIEPAPERAGQTVRIFLEPEPAKDNLLLIGLAVAIGVLQIRDEGDAKDHGSVFVRIQPDGNVQTLSKSGNSLRPSLRVEF